MSFNGEEVFFQPTANVASGADVFDDAALFCEAVGSGPRNPDPRGRGRGHGRSGPRDGPTDTDANDECARVLRARSLAAAFHVSAMQGQVMPPEPYPAHQPHPSESLTVDWASINPLEASGAEERRRFVSRASQIVASKLPTTSLP